MKTPEEIKRSLKVHAGESKRPCYGCAYRCTAKMDMRIRCDKELLDDAITYIKQLESKLNQAVEDMRMLGRIGANICPVCAHHNHGEGSKEHSITCIINRETDNFEWRGAKGE